MNLIEQAELDLSFTLEDDQDGFGIPVVLESPSPDNTRFGESGDVIARTNDIGFFIEPGTDIGTMGRNVEVDFRLSTLKGLGIEIKKGWKIEFTNKNGELWKFGIEMIPHDRQIGLVKCVLEVLNDGAN